MRSPYFGDDCRAGKRYVAIKVFAGRQAIGDGFGRFKFNFRQSLECRNRRGNFSLIGHTARVRAIDFSPDGKQLATGSSDGNTLISLGTQERIRFWKAAPVEK